MSEDEKRPEQELDDLRQSIEEQVKESIDEFIEENKGCNRDKINDSIDYDGRVTEMVDSAVPIHYYDLTRLATLSDIYHHENESPPAYDGTMTPINVIVCAIYEVLMEVAWETVESYLDELEEEGKFGDSDD